MPLFLSQRGFIAFALLVDLRRILQTRALALSAMEEDPEKSPVNEKNTPAEVRIPARPPA